tara:strand:- start:2048 stop:2944 length:897 start_codon:yes stop_codon:yes gene_type:complete
MQLVDREAVLIHACDPLSDDDDQQAAHFFLTDTDAAKVAVVEWLIENLPNGPDCVTMMNFTSFRCHVVLGADDRRALYFEAEEEVDDECIYCVGTMEQKLEFFELVRSGRLPQFVSQWSNAHIRVVPTRVRTPMDVERTLDVLEETVLLPELADMIVSTAGVPIQQIPVNHEPVNLVRRDAMVVLSYNANKDPFSTTTSYYFFTSSDEDKINFVEWLARTLPFPFLFSRVVTGVDGGRAIFVHDGKRAHGVYPIGTTREKIEFFSVVSQNLLPPFGEPLCPGGDFMVCTFTEVRKMRS